jgi:glycosyltransferase involved in cell wall biosynthesis
MSRFPSVTETFILYEILELERRGVRVEVFPLLRHREEVAHAEVRAVVERTRYPRLSWALVAAQLYWLRRAPRAYVRAWRAALWGNRASAGFLLRTLLVVPTAALFAQQMETLGIQRMHAHWATHPTLAAYVVRMLTGIPYSFTCHAHDLYVERTMLAEKVAEAEAVVTISDFNRRLLEALYGPEVAAKTVVVRCGIDPDVFRPRQRQPNERFTLLCVASLREYKGHRYLLEACARLREDGLAFECLLVGDGEDRPEVEGLIARLGLSQHVRLLGRQPRDKVSRLMAQADLLIMPSVVTRNGQMEGIPVALMEALASQTPVVATRISGVPELVEDERTGLLVPEKDGEALAAAVLRLAGDAELARRLAVAGRAKVLEEFSLPKNVDKLLRVLAGTSRVPAPAGSGAAPAALGAQPLASRTASS